MIKEYKEKYKDIQLARKEMEEISRAVSSYNNCNFLVFGAGYDTPYWFDLIKNRGGRLVVLENNPIWIYKIRALCPGVIIIPVNYHTKRDSCASLLHRFDLLDILLPIDIIKTPWDVILIDGPAGNMSEFPGRASSIYMSSKLIKNNGDILVHDINRQEEYMYCSKYLGDENKIKTIGFLNHYKMKSNRQKYLEYELFYWKKEGLHKEPEFQNKKYIAYLDMFNEIYKLPENKSCIEVGPGPFGGMYNVFKAKEWCFIDELSDIYRSWVGDKDNVTYMNTSIEDFPASTKEFDIVFSTNTLDHTKNRTKSLQAIYKLIKKDGLFCLMVHCRTESELNAGHKQVITPEMMLQELKQVGFKIIGHKIYKKKLFLEQRTIYQTFLGVMQK